MQAGWNNIMGRRTSAAGPAAPHRRRRWKRCGAAANLAFKLCPMLTQGAIEAISHVGPESLRRRTCRRWSRRMDRHHEPDRAAGGQRPLAGAHQGTPQADGSYRLKGQKIFITYGEHDYTENIIHLVLARIDGAPEG
jgi:alkylation response protein AidB-like acyl-CoA dehydrogenase